MGLAKLLVNPRKMYSFFNMGEIFLLKTMAKIVRVHADLENDQALVVEFRMAYRVGSFGYGLALPDVLPGFVDIEDLIPNGELHLVQFWQAMEHSMQDEKPTGTMCISNGACYLHIRLFLFPNNRFTLPQNSWQLFFCHSKHRKYKLLQLIFAFLNQGGVILLISLLRVELYCNGQSFVRFSHLVGT